MTVDQTEKLNTPLTEKDEFVFINFKVDWADEMYVYGYAIMHLHEWNTEVDYAKSFFDKKVAKKVPSKSYRPNPAWMVYVGTNEEVYFDDFDEWFSCFSVFPLKGTTALEMLALLGEGKAITSYEYGQFILPSNDDDDDEDDEEDDGGDDGDDGDDDDDGDGDTGGINPFAVIHDLNKKLEEIKAMEKSEAWDEITDPELLNESFERLMSHIHNIETKINEDIINKLDKSPDVDITSPKSSNTPPNTLSNE